MEVGSTEGGSSMSNCPTMDDDDDDDNSPCDIPSSSFLSGGDTMTHWAVDTSGLKKWGDIP